MIDQQSLVKDLSSLIGKENVSGNIFERLAYAQDAAQPDVEPAKIPLAVAKPQSAQGVSEVLKYAGGHKIPVYIHGAGTAFKGSPRPKRPGSILLSTQGLTAIEPHEEDMYYELGAGVNLYELENFLLSRGYMLPMTIGSKFCGDHWGSRGHQYDRTHGGRVCGQDHRLCDGCRGSAAQRSYYRVWDAEYSRGRQAWITPGFLWVRKDCSG